MPERDRKGFKDMEYTEFLKSKMEIAGESGFAVNPDEISPALKPHQRDAVIWALRGGRRALFESFGLGKTVQELEFCHQAVRKSGGRALVVCPLGVKQEFTRDAVELLGYEKPEYVRSMGEVEKCSTEIMITNYERVRDGNIDPAYFTATSLDEASVLRSFGSKTYQTFLDKFRGGALQTGCDRNAVPEQVQGADTLCRIPGSDGHRPGTDKVFPEGQHKGKQPDTVPEHGGRILDVDQQLGAVCHKTIRHKPVLFR